MWSLRIIHIENCDARKKKTVTRQSNILPCEKKIIARCLILEGKPQMVHWLTELEQTCGYTYLYSRVDTITQISDEHSNIIPQQHVMLYLTTDVLTPYRDSSCRSVYNPDFKLRCPFEDITQIVQGAHIGLNNAVWKQKVTSFFQNQYES